MPTTHWRPTHTHIYPGPLTPSLRPGTKDTLTTTLIVKGLPLTYSQLQVTITIHRLLGVKNVVSIYYTNAQEDDLGRHEGSAIINCLNATVYTHWSYKMAVLLLGKLVDFIPHRRSLAGSNPLRRIQPQRCLSRPRCPPDSRSNCR